MLIGKLGYGGSVFMDVPLINELRAAVYNLPPITRKQNRLLKQWRSNYEFNKKTLLRRIMMDASLCKF